MEPDTFRGGAGSDVYWRRRMAVLVGVLVVVAVVAWACSSVAGPERSADSAAPFAGIPSPDPLLASLYAASQSTPKATPSAEESSPKPKRDTRRPGDDCDPDDLVVSLSGKREVYPEGTRPTFLVTLVNTGRFMCRVDVGPRALELRITSGQDRIWSSSDCISGEGVDIRRLRRGIPYVRPVTWDRRRSAENCRAERLKARPGTYVAVVRGEDMRSAKAVFHLR